MHNYYAYMPTRLDALAHPVRARVLAALRDRGIATASDLARDLDTHTGATSYHLRKLAESDLIEEVPGGHGRQRRWQARGDSAWQLPTLDAEADDEQTTLSWVDRDLLRHAAQRTDAWLDRMHSWPQDWGEVLGIHDDYVVATAEQLHDLRREIADVIDRYRRVGQANPSARRVALWTAAYPVDLDRPPRDPAS